MKLITHKIVILIFLVFCNTSINAALNDDKEVFKSGNWKVLRSNDPMTDKAVCTGIYKDRYAIQLSETALYIRVSGGIESIKLRFDGAEPQSLKPAREIEKKIRSIVIEGSDFTQLKSSSRFRVQIGTLVSGVVDEDIDLNGFNEALANINSGCPIVADKPVKANTKGCSDAAKEKMKSQKMKQSQIDEICN
jgi:hypothetical protein